jgi:hypothetical protein
MPANYGLCTFAAPFTRIDVPGALATGALGINDQGKIVGEYADSQECLATGIGCHGFLLDNGVFTLIDVPGAATTVPFGINDQGHIAAKLLARDATAALTIGSPILFSSVAHGSAHDIAGKGIASPTAMIEAVLHLSKAGRCSAAA